ncbi:MAG: ATP-binding protein [Polyangiales bacterium]
MIDAIADPVFVKDDSHQWQLLNQAFCDLMGRERQELIGRSDHDFFPKEEADVFHAKDQLVLQTGEANVNEEIVTDGDGDSRIMVTKKSAFDDASGRRFLVGTIRDVTEVKRAQNELMQTRLELEALLKKRTAEAAEAQKLLLHCQKMDTLGELAGGIAHDFNNLLAVISASLELIVRTKQSGNEPDKVGTAALNAIQRGTALTQRLLEFSRQESLTPQPIALSTIIEGVELLLSRTLSSKVMLTAAVEDPSLIVSVDHAQMEAAILNLCVNARNAMPEGGEIRLRVHRAELDDVSASPLALAAGAYALVDVSDAGVGMTPEVAARAFEPFYTTRPDGKGTGLGLSMVNAFAVQAQGAVNITSVVGKGTTVTLYLPLSASQRSPAVERQTPKSANRNLTLLVVDDDSHLQSVLTRSLQVLGYQAMGASGIEAARQAVVELPRLDVLVVDTLVRESRDPLIAALTSAHPAAKIIFMSSFAEGDTSMASKHGAPVLQKPFPLARLDEAIQELCALPS